MPIILCEFNLQPNCEKVTQKKIPRNFKGESSLHTFTRYKDNQHLVYLLKGTLRECWCLQMKAARRWVQILEEQSFISRICCDALKFLKIPLLCLQSFKQTSCWNQLQRQQQQQQSQNFYSQKTNTFDHPHCDKANKMEGLDTHATRSYLKFSSCISEFSLNGMSICIQLPQHLQKNHLSQLKSCALGIREACTIMAWMPTCYQRRSISADCIRWKFLASHTWLEPTHPPSLTHSPEHQCHPDPSLCGKQCGHTVDGFPEQCCACIVISHPQNLTYGFSPFEFGPSPQAFAEPVDHLPLHHHYSHPLKNYARIGFLSLYCFFHILLISSAPFCGIHNILNLKRLPNPVEFWRFASRPGMCKFLCALLMKAANVLRLV